MNPRGADLGDGASPEQAAANRRVGWILFGVFTALAAFSIAYIVVCSFLRRG